MRSTSRYASIWCILLHQLQPRDSMAPITRGLPMMIKVVFTIAPIECVNGFRYFQYKKSIPMIDALTQIILTFRC